MVVFPASLAWRHERVVPCASSCVGVARPHSKQYRWWIQSLKAANNFWEEFRQWWDERVRNSFGHAVGVLTTVSSQAFFSTHASGNLHVSFTWCTLAVFKIVFFWISWHHSKSYADDFLSGGLKSPQFGHCLRGILHQIRFLFDCSTCKYHKHRDSSRHHATWGTLIVTVIFELTWPPATLVMLLVARNCTWRLRGSAWLVLCPYLAQMLSVIFWFLNCKS